MCALPGVTVTFGLFGIVSTAVRVQQTEYYICVPSVNLGHLEQIGQNLFHCKQSFVILLLLLRKLVLFHFAIQCTTLFWSIT